MAVLARWIGAEAKHFLPLFLLLASLLLLQRNSWLAPYDLQSFLFLAYCGGLYYWLEQRHYWLEQRRSARNAVSA